MQAFLKHAVLPALALLIVNPQLAAGDPLLPRIDGAWWQVAGDPDLGEYTSPKQQPVDFGVWQAADGTWQLWSCIRHTKCGGSTRLFYRWEGKRLTDPDWTPKGIAMEADPSLGETKGGLQAPHVIRVDGTYYMFYGDWGRICLARSEDGKEFTRVLNADGQPNLFSGPYDNTRDPMVLKVGNLYHCYYMGHRKEAELQSAIFCRTSHDLLFWSKPVMVSAGGVAATQPNWWGGDAECPFVLQKDGRYYLFRNQRYGENNLNTQYASPNPFAFGVDDDRYRIGTLPVAAPEIIHHEGQDYIAALMPSLKGIRIAKLAWSEPGGETSSVEPRETLDGSPGPDTLVSAPLGTRGDAILLGAYYYPWYRGEDEKGKLGWMRRALRGRLQPRQLPKLGVYDSADPEVVGDHIAQSRRAGIDFWAVSWWGPRRVHDRNFREAILKHPDAGKLKYAVLYESTGRLGSLEKPDYSNLVEDFEYLAETFFEQPQYLKIDSKPVVFIYLTRVYFRDRGLEALKRLRDRFPQVWLVGDEIFGPRYRKRDARLWDAITAYDVYGQSLRQHGATQKAIDQLKGNYDTAREIAGEVDVGFVPAISPGFNDRAVRDGHVGRARYFTDREDSKEGDVFREMIRQVAIPLADSRAQRMVMITSFNEWYEDTQIEATAGDRDATRRDDSESGKHYTQGQKYVDYGPLYLDILREELERARQ